METESTNPTKAPWRYPEIKFFPERCVGWCCSCTSSRPRWPWWRAIAWNSFTNNVMEETETEYYEHKDLLSLVKIVFGRQGEGESISVRPQRFPNLLRDIQLNTISAGNVESFPRAYIRLLIIWKLTVWLLCCVWCSSSSSATTTNQRVLELWPRHRDFVGWVEKADGFHGPSRPVRPSLSWERDKPTSRCIKSYSILLLL